jgi:hypothetical protein
MQNMRRRRYLRCITCDSAEYLLSTHWALLSYCTSLPKTGVNYSLNIDDIALAVLL